MLLYTFYVKKQKRGENMKRVKTIIAVLLSVCIILGNMGTSWIVNAQNNQLKEFKEDNAVISVKKVCEWDNGYVADVNVNNVTNSVIENWKIDGELKGVITDVWNAEKTQSEENVTFFNAGWNRNIEKGQNVNFGIRVENGKFEDIKNWVLKKSNRKIVSTEDYGVEFQLQDQWDKHAIFNVKIHNMTNQPFINWKLSFPNSMKLENIWNAQICDEKDNTYEIGYMNYNAEIIADGDVAFGFQAEFVSESDIKAPENCNLTCNGDEQEEDKYLILDGIIEENELELYWTSSNPTDQNQIYLSTGTEYEQLAEVDTSSYKLKLDNYTSDLSFYIMEEKNGEVQQSNTLHIIYEDGKFRVDEKDTDGDGLEDIYEQLLGMKADNVDSDDDGINDYDEVIEGLNPLKADSSEDADGDGLTALEELQYGTYIFNEDSDGDSINDKQELEQGTDPLCDDTDLDEVDDATEYALNLDPLKEDTDGDGVLDGKEKCEISREIKEDVSVKATIDLSLNAAQVNSFSMDVVDNDDIFLGEQLPGYLGEAYNFDLDGDFASATLSMEYDESLVTDNFVPTIYYFNEETQELEELENQTIQGNVVSAKLEHFSKYILVNKTAYMEEWKIPKIDLDMNQCSKNLDIIFAIDSSGSMQSNDADGLRKKLSKKFVDELGKNDRVAVVDFDDKAKVLAALSNDKAEAKKAIDKINSNGGTDIVAALEKALSEIKDKNKKENKKMLVLLTDGQSSTANAEKVCKSLKNYETSIYCIGLGKDVNATFLKKISNLTDGEYYHADDADELSKYFKKIKQQYELSKDTDGDGICDYFEDNFQSGTGCKDKLDKTMKDSDEDGLEDREEIVEIKKDKDGFYKGFRLKSDPTKKDTDGDELWDNEDATPFRKWVPKSSIGKAVQTFGFLYSEKDDKIYAKKNCWQDKLGYCRAYDEGAEAIGFLMDCEPIYFHYDESDWLAELWKGQYRVETGAELGFYGIDHSLNIINWYSVKKDFQPKITLEVKKNGTPFLTKGRSTHWWQTGFRWGEYVANPEDELSVKVTIEFDNDTQLRAFLTGTDKKSECKKYQGLNAYYQDVNATNHQLGKPLYYVINKENKVSFTVSEPQSTQPKKKAVAKDINKKENKKLVDVYNEILDEFNVKNNDPNNLPLKSLVKKRCSEYKYKIYCKFLSEYIDLRRKFNKK